MKRIVVLVALLTIVSFHCLAQDESYVKGCRAHFTLEDSIPSMNFDEFLANNIVFIDNGADAVTLCTIEFDVVGTGIIDNIHVSSLGNVDFVEIAVKEAVKKSEPYWILDSSALGNKVRVQFKYKWMLY